MTLHSNLDQPRKSSNSRRRITNLSFFSNRTSMRWTAGAGGRGGGSTSLQKQLDAFKDVKI